MKKCLDVVAACIRSDGKFLICQRKKDDYFGLLWEFPGGVIEAGESHSQAICREIREELGVAIEPGELIHIFEDENEYLKIKVHLFDCVIQNGNPQILDCNDFRYTTIEEARAFDLAPVDKKILTYLQANDF